MADLKREYVIPLRRKTRTAPRWRRSKKAVSVLKDYVRKHMKTDDVIVCKELNELIWKDGARHPPGKVSVTALRTDVAGEPRTLVNLSSAGVDKQLERYRTQAAGPQAVPKATEEAGDLENKVQEAEVKEEPKEVKKEEPKAEEKKVEEKPTTAKKTEAKVEKKEVKKNE